MTATITVPTAPSRRRWDALHALLGGRVAPWVIGLFATLVSLIGIGTPSYWGDEAASVLAAERPLPVMFGMIGHIDAVHGLYYAFLHVWTGAFGTAEAVTRFPSAIGVGLAAAGTVVLARSIFTSAIGITAGLVFAVIPQVTRMGAETRSYALGMAAVVWLTVWFVSLVRRRSTSRRSWALFAIASAASMYLFLYLAMLLLVHATWMVLQRPGRRVMRAWGWSLVGALVLGAPIVIAGIAQREQIAFLGRRDYATPESVLVGQWFQTPAFAVLAWLLIVLAPVGVLVVRRSSRQRRALAMIAVWALAPTALLIIGNTLVTPMYNLRYVTFCVPAVAIMMALGLRTIVELLPKRVDRAVATAVGVALVLALAIPVLAEQRGPFAKDDGSDLRQTAEVVQAHASPGDAVVFDQSVKPSRKSRLAIDLYPQAFAGLDDVALETSYRDRPELWDLAAPLSEIHDRLIGHDTVWVVEGSSTSPNVADLEALGYHVEQRIPVHRSIVFELVRS
ncbi:hypothetical protein EAO79_05480 [Plantibacter sp. PA-3-X8]|uniref:glycosyltransferase family 39 protein n=1 Tax=Plantibacter sp. PA-3-X8 TaxID=2480625 RepID=UPI000F5EB9CC|nr:glycosyltransferase family 39 protein [Plantibacter sp. PA-3-X8]AZH82410.1 hypothetical protein EAO79_05480 [Plantibacter sp. PA-3-X8]